MRFEEQVTNLCAQALAAHDEKEAGQILAELRMLVHQRIEHLRSYVQASYRAAAGVPSVTSMRTWQKVVQEITIEPDPKRVLQLTRELNILLQGIYEPVARRESA